MLKRVIIRLNKYQVKQTYKAFKISIRTSYNVHFSVYAGAGTTPIDDTTFGCYFQNVRNFIYSKFQIKISFTVMYFYKLNTYESAANSHSLSCVAYIVHKIN